MEVSASTSSVVRSFELEVLIKSSALVRHCSRTFNAQRGAYPGIKHAMTFRVAVLLAALLTFTICCLSADTSSGNDVTTGEAALSRVAESPRDVGGEQEVTYSTTSDFKRPLAHPALDLTHARLSAPKEDPIAPEQVQPPSPKKLTRGLCEQHHTFIQTSSNKPLSGAETKYSATEN